jgi:hypothetical protein
MQTTEDEMIGIVERLRFDASRCEIQFSKGVAGNIEEAANEIEQLRTVLKDIYHQSNEAGIRNMAWRAVTNGDRA